MAEKEIKKFKLVSQFLPKGDQPGAIDKLFEGIKKGVKNQVLLGVTGSGKTFTMANIIEKAGRPALVMAPNKTLAAQLYSEFKELFPDNAVEYFVSYYDYYQPEAYIPTTDTYIEKDASINDEIDKLRHSATHSLLTRRDVIIVSSVSCIYGIGSPEDYGGMHLYVYAGMNAQRDKLLASLVNMQYERGDHDFCRGRFRVMGDVVEVFPVYEDERALRIEFFGDYIDRISEIDPLTGRTLGRFNKLVIHPASHYVVPEDRTKSAIEAIREELRERLEELINSGAQIEAKRLEQRILFDLELMEEMGFCPGIENYSRHLDGRSQGEPPYTLLDYFPKDFILFIDESHISIPQIGGMYKGDRSRKKTLVEYGFRLPSALDNRPLKFDEFEERIGRVIYVSATPSPYEIERSKGHIVEQIIRPTGLTDPAIEVRPADGQIDDLLYEIRKRAETKERTLVTTLTKRMAEDLASYYTKLGVKVKYLHSDVNTLERIEIIRDLRLGKFDVLIGINLLREGLDIPEVSLVAILDADKEGFLRSETSLIQTCGRASRNINGRVIMYAGSMTSSMKNAIDETMRRRKLQEEYNKKMGITPESIKSSIKELITTVYEKDYSPIPEIKENHEKYMTSGAIKKDIAALKQDMKEAAKKLEFEKAARLRDRIKSLEETELEIA